MSPLATASSTSPELGLEQGELVEQDLPGRAAAGHRDPVGVAAGQAEVALERGRQVVQGGSLDHVDVG